MSAECQSRIKLGHVGLPISFLVHHAEKMDLRRLAVTILILLSLVRQSRQTQTRSGQVYNPDILGQNIGSLKPKAIEFVPKRREREPRFKPRKNRTQRKCAAKVRGTKRPTYKTIKVYSQNVHGLFESAKNENGKAIKRERTFVKREYVVDMMRRKEINIFLMQETWDEGDYTKDLGSGYIMFHHNSKKKRGRTGVAIVIAPHIAKMWREDGGNDAITIQQFEGRFIGIHIQMPEFNTKGKRIKDRWQKLFITSVYHPYDDTHFAFNSELDEVLSRMADDRDIVMGGDMNAQVGRRRDSDPDSYSNVLGPFGLEAQNDKGRDLLQVYLSNKLCIMNTFYEASSHVTHISCNKEKTECMLDMTSVSKGIFSRVSDCRKVDDGIRSDHSAICLKLMTCSIEFNRAGAVSNGEVDREKILNDSKTNSDFNKCFDGKWDKETCYEDFC